MEAVDVITDLEGLLYRAQVAYGGMVKQLCQRRSTPMHWLSCSECISKEESQMAEESQDRGSAPTPDRFRASCYDLYMYLGRNSADQQCRLVISLEGRLDEERMARAVRLTLEEEPVLGCRFVLRRWRPYWERREDLDSIDTLLLVDDDRIEERLWSFITQPMDPCKDLQVQIGIFRSRCDKLCIKLNHVAADGEGAKRYAYLLASVYRALGENHPCSPPIVSGEARNGATRFGFETLSRLSALGASISPWPTWGFPWSATDLTERAHSVRLIQPATFECIRGYAASEGASINEVLLATFYRALFTLINPPAGVVLPTQVPVDLRRHLTTDEAYLIRNCFGAMYPSISRVPGESFGATLARVRQVTSRLKSKNAGLGESLFLSLFLAFGFSTARMFSNGLRKRLVASGNSHPFLSNLGVIDEVRLDFGKPRVSDAFIPSLVDFPPHFMLAVSTFRNTMTLSIGFCHPQTHRPIVDRFLDLFIAELPL